MNDLLLLAYLLGVAAVGYAADQRTCGTGIGLVLGLLTTPFLGAILILAWPSREEYAYWKRDLIGGAGRKKAEEG